MRPDPEDAAPIPLARKRSAERAARAETRALLLLADEAFARFSCPSTAECCQLGRTGRQPWLWPTEWNLLAGGRPLPLARTDGGCPFLDSDGARCTRYPDRPFGCRTFFCDRRVGPRRQPLEAVVSLSERLEALNQRLHPDIAGPRPLLELLEEARAPTTRD